jgi:hypothetical protein
MELGGNFTVYNGKGVEKVFTLQGVRGSFTAYN